MEKDIIIETEKWVKVDSNIWAGYGLFKNAIFCKIYLKYTKKLIVVNIVCGGKHFWRKLKNNFNSFEEAESYFYSLYKNLYAKIPDYVSPDWFEQKNFEWM